MEHLLSAINSRRFFLKNLGALSASVFLTSLGGCESLFKAIANRPTRRRLRSTPEVDAVLEIYKRAIRYLQDPNTIPTSDRRSWLSQAHIHGTPAGFNFCHRDNREFLTWHRAYLFQFEKICQQASGDSNFAIPYWNWTLDNSIPAKFLEAGSVLNVSRNRTALSSSVSSIFSHSNLNSILSDNNYYSFSERLRGGPHNTAHSNIGGTLGGFDSPLDPLFWAHHCMVDYCWYDWNVNRHFDNPNDADFMNREWNHFANTDGTARTLKTLDTLLMPFLAFQYEDSQVGQSTVMFALRAKKDFKEARKRIEEGAPVKFEVKKKYEVAKALTLRINNFSSSLAEGSTAELNRLSLGESSGSDRVYCNITLADYPKINDFFVRVFVNLPQDKLENRTDSIHYAGSFAIFGVNTGSPSGHEHHQEPTALVEITEVIRNLKSKQMINDNDPIQVQLIPVPFDQQSERDAVRDVITLSKVELLVTPVTIVTGKRSSR